VDTQNTGLAGPMRAAQVRQNGPIRVGRRRDHRWDEAGHAEAEHPLADAVHVGGGIGEVVTEGTVDLDVEKAREDPGGLAAETALSGLSRAVNGDHDTIVDGYQAQSAVFGGEQMAKQLDHGVNVTFA
jgi:hypothetical protein